MRRLWVLGLCLCLISCSSKKYGDHPPYPTSGQVLVNGQPAKEAVVILYHRGNWGERSIVPQGWTDEEGRFVLSTYDVNDGAPAGDYQVEIFWPAYRRKDMGPDKLGEKFANHETSGLKAHVEPGTNELPPFELQAKLVDVKVDAKIQKKGKRQR
ncbi:MAG TPA: hypothetical protein VKI17_13725 [Gemmataceae bacterium]|nr:hypothetical protein [Gemmataceae bacterium]